MVYVLDGSSLGLSVFFPDGVLYEREKDHFVAVNIEGLDGVVFLVCPLGSLRV
jgi:hypothetical protein